MAELGEMIRKRRDELGLTLDDLQARTKIRGKYLEAIEAGEYQVIPGEVYLRGFIRSIASELEMDADKALRTYQQDTGKVKDAAVGQGQTLSVKTDVPSLAVIQPERVVLAKPAEVEPVLPVRSSRVEPRQVSQPRKVPWLLIGLVLVLVGSAGYWYWTSNLNRLPADPPIAQDPTPGPDDPGEGGDPQPDPGPQVVLQDPNAADLVYLVKQDRITITVTAVKTQCWLRAEYGNQVIEKTLKAGSTTDASLGFQSDQQVKIRLGNAPAVKLIINEEEQLPLQGAQVRTVTVKIDPNP